MINASPTSPSENPQPSTPVNPAEKQNFKISMSSNDGLKVTSTPNNPPSKPTQKKKMPLKMILGGIILVLLVVGSGVGLYLSQQTQDIRQDASELVDPSENTLTPPGYEGSSIQSGCNYSCSDGHPSTPQISGTNCGNVKAMDVCRGKGYTGDPDGKYYNCQLCRLSNSARDKLSSEERSKRQAQNWYACPGEETDSPTGNCDYSCLCGNADQNTCYEKGPNHDAGVFNGSYNCKNTQVDVVNGGAASSSWDCRSTDNRDWSECAPPPASPPVCQSAVIDGGTVVGGVKQLPPDQNVVYNVTSTDGTTAVEFCFHAKNLVGDRTWSQDWHCLNTPKASSGQNLYTGSFKFNEIKNAIVNMGTGYTASAIENDGLMYATRIHTSENVFCTGNDVWSDGGTHYGSTTCTYNDACAGDIGLAPKIAGPACESIQVTGGSLVSGIHQVTTGATPMTYTLTGKPPAGGTIAKNEICFYPNTLANKGDYTLGWYCVTPNPKNTNPYTVTKTYNEIKAGIRARDPGSAKITDAQIDADGFRYAGNVHAPERTFCDGGNNWTGVGDSLYPACTFNHAGCAGHVKLVVTPPSAQCGASGCTDDSSCGEGLTCTTASNGQKYCAKNNAYNVEACSENPNTANCCQAEEVIQCNSNCSNNTECSSALGTGYSCISNKCRLTENPDSTSCTPLTAIACNGSCKPGPVGDAQCQKTNPDYYCAVQGNNLGAGRCRHKDWPEQLNCKKPDPVCIGISMSPLVPKINESVSFTCGLVNGVDNYQFRLFEPGTTTPITIPVSDKNISTPYQVTKPGSFRAECRLCPTSSSGETTCLSWPE